MVARARSVRIDQERHARCAWRQLLQELQTLEFLFDTGQREAGHISYRARQIAGKPRQRSLASRTNDDRDRGRRVRGCSSARSGGVDDIRPQTDKLGRKSGELLLIFLGKPKFE